MFWVLLGCGNSELKTGKLLVATGYVRQNIGVITRCQSKGTIYGERISDSHWVSSSDLGDTWVDTGSSVLTSPAQYQQCYFFHGFKFLTTNDGRIFRTTPDDWNNWTEVSVPQPPPMTTNRPDELAANDQYLFYGTYNNQLFPCFVFRSGDNGATWVSVLSAPNNHIHGILIDPAHRERVFVDIGDLGGLDSGLWYSPANGDPGSFIHLSSNLNGVDLLFHNQDILMEGDGLDSPQVLIFPHADNPQPGPTQALLPGNPNPPDGKGTLEGIARAMALTSEGNLFFITKAEGVDRHRSGIFMAAGPSLTQEVLLEEIPVNSIPLCRTMELGPYLFMERYRIRKPTLSFQ